MKDFDFTYISFGAGVQSTALLACSAMGLYGFPKADCAIFADTGDEPSWVYQHLEFMEKWAGERGVEVIRCQKGHLSQDIIDRHRGKKKRFAAIPGWTMGSDGRAAPLRRQCTREYKIEPIEKAVRELLGYRKRQRMKHKVRCLIGISYDEIIRIKDSRTPWVTNEWPLVDARFRRHDCIEIVKGLGIPEPGKSSCVGCPYHSDRFYRELKEKYPEEFQKAVEFDRTIRNMSMNGVRSPVYVHRSLKPLEEVDFTKNQMELFGEECSGTCGV